MSARSAVYSAPFASLDWREGAPVSTAHSDVYFPPGKGIEAAEHVFLQPNNFPNRLQKCRDLCVSELGFGSGLNFLLTADYWRREGGSGWLTYVSFENAPLSPADLKQALQPFESLRPLSHELLQYYPLPLLGLHPVLFPDWRVRLLLYVGDALRGLSELSFTAEAWYLDGFSPEKNESLWSESVINAVADHSALGTTLGTFSAAGSVRRRLERAGFQVSKIPGLPPKRESIQAVFQGSRPAPVMKRHSVAVVGGGVAGLTTAHALSRCGHEVVLFESESALLSQASGNPEAVLLPYLTNEPTVQSELYLHAYLMTLRHLQQLGIASEPSPGILHFPSTKRLEKLFTRLPSLKVPTEIAEALTQKEVQAMLGTNAAAGAFHYRQGRSVSPPELTAALRAGAGEIRLNSQAAKLLNRSGLWTVAADDGSEHVFDKVVLSNASAIRSFQQTAWIPVEPVRGQIVSVEASKQTRTLQHILCYDGYCLPPREGSHLMGASYSHDNTALLPSRSESEEIISRLIPWVPGFDLQKQPIRSERASLRTTTFDRFPFAGELPVVEGGTLEVQPNWGLYCCVGLGSRGFISSTIAADLIAAEISGFPAPIPEPIRAKLLPSRAQKHLTRVD